MRTEGNVKVNKTKTRVSEREEEQEEVEGKEDDDEERVVSKGSESACFVCVWERESGN